MGSLFPQASVVPSVRKDSPLQDAESYDVRRTMGGAGNSGPKPGPEHRKANLGKVYGEKAFLLPCRLLQILRRPGGAVILLIFSLASPSSLLPTGSMHE